MVFSIPIISDTTIYENDQFLNTGIDPLCEIYKLIDNNTIYEARTLLNFNTSPIITTLDREGLIISGSITTPINSILKMYYDKGENIPTTQYTINAYIISQQWQGGDSVYYINKKPVREIDNTNGACWKTVAGYNSSYWIASSSIWNTTRATWKKDQDIWQLTTLTGSNITWNTNVGGGSWYTSPSASQIFTYKSSQDINMDITTIMDSLLQGIPNNGIILMLNRDEVVSGSFKQNHLYFNSSETHEVYDPQIYIQWVDQIYNITTEYINSITTYKDDPILFTKYFSSQYKTDTKIRINIGCRPRYPRPLFTQHSDFIQEQYLPQKTYYQIRDMHDGHIVIPFSEYTLISTTLEEGSYFEFYTTMLYPNHFYEYEIKIDFGNNLYKYYRYPEFSFKIID